MTLPAQPRFAVVGATGVVGREALAILEERRFPLAGLRLFASPRSVGTTLPFAGDDLPVEPLTEASFDDVDLALFCAGGAISRRFAAVATRAGATVIDNSSAFRMEDGVPLVVPEINGDACDGAGGAAPPLVANPNCSTIIALLAVTPLHRAVGVERMVVSTYQAASGAGRALMEELERQTREFAAGRPLTTTVAGRPYLFNVFSHDSAIGPDGYNEEERKLARETRKIWGDEQVRITATCVRVPVLRSHAEAINLTFRAPLGEGDARALLADAPGVRLVDDREANAFPEPAVATGRDEVLVGRIRTDPSQPRDRGLDLFVCGDQLRKGAALNAIQIAERLCGIGEEAAAAARPA